MPNPVTNATLDALRQIDTPTIANAIEPFDVRSNTEGFMGWDIGCMFPELGVMVGFAVTATLDTVTHGRVHDSGPRLEFFEAIEDSPKPAVIVLKDVGPRRSHGCHFGDGLATVSKKLGAIGLVTDAGVRDVETVREMGFHYFAPGMVPAHGNFGFLEAQVPVEVSGVVVNPGDIIHADANGVVTIPAEIASHVIEEAARIHDRESAQMAWVNSVEFSLDALRRRG
jgi:regulator of RNase E activity RraA